MKHKNIKPALILVILYSLSQLVNAQTPTSDKLSNVLKTLKPGVTAKSTAITPPATPGSEQPASSRITDGREPSEVVGYLTWVDPDTQVKHLIKGQDRRTGEWKTLNTGSNLVVHFRNVNTHEIFRVNFNGGNYFTGIDNRGMDVGNIQDNWNESRMPVALRYRFIFSFDLNYNGNPVVSDVSTNGVANDQTIRYNPNIWKFYDITSFVYLEDPRNSYSIPLEDFPVRPADPTKRTTRFSDLPDF